MTHRRRTRAGSGEPGQVLLALLLLLAVLQAPAGALAQPRIGLVGDLVHQFTVAPGQVYEGLLVLTNPGDEPEEVRLYQYDYVSDAEGRGVYSEPGKHPRSNAAWLRLGQDRVVVPPGQQVAVAYTVRVPQDATLKGTYWSVIIVEPVEANVTAPAEASPGPRIAMRQVWRYAVHVVTDIGATGQVRLTFAQPRLVKDREGNFVFQVDLVNDGERWLQPAVWLELYDQRGASVGRFEGLYRRLYPGSSGRQRIPLGRLTPGSYQALLVADNGDAQVFAARYTFTVKAD